MDKSKVLIIIDRGHGSTTPGKCSPLFEGIDGKKTRFYEWKYVREISDRVVEQLKAEGYTNIYIVNPEDKDVPLVTRKNRINNKYADIRKKGMKAFMISIHVNAAGNGPWMNARGWSGWTSKGQTGGDKLADKLYEAANEVLTPLNQRIRKDMSDGDPDWESNFYILKNTNCPACLTENMFQDNREDVDWLLSEEGKQAITDIHVKGIKKYIASL